MAYNAGPQRISEYLKAGEVPERFHQYPRRVFSEVRRLHRRFRDDAAPLVAGNEKGSRRRSLQ